LKGSKYDPFTGTKVPVVKAADLEESKVCAAAAEVYLEDGEFARVTKMSKEAFYGLDKEKRGEVRRKLLNHGSF
jgi:hypothetical protein